MMIKRKNKIKKLIFYMKRLIRTKILLKYYLIHNKFLMIALINSAMNNMNNKILKILIAQPRQTN